MAVSPLIDVDAVRTRLARRFGPDVAPWCAALPDLVNDLAVGWHLTLVPAWPNGGTSVVIPCESSAGERRVLKLTPDPKIAADEAAALGAWASSPHAVTLYAADPGRGALLLERILPGTRLADERDRYPVEEIAPVLEDLWRPAPGPGQELPDLRERADFLLDLTSQRLGRYPAAAERVPPGLIEASRHLARELTGDGPKNLIHGDLHPGNVLRGASGRDNLVAIDPRPCRGDPAFDAIDWVLADGGDELEVRQRIERLAARVAGLDPDRVWAWCRAMAVVVGVIAVVARGDLAAGERMIALARRLKLTSLQKIEA